MAKFLRAINSSVKFGGHNDKILEDRKKCVDWDNIQRTILAPESDCPCQQDEYAHSLEYGFGCEPEICAENPMNCPCPEGESCLEEPMSCNEHCPNEQPCIFDVCEEHFCQEEIVCTCDETVCEIVAPVRSVFDVFRDARRKAWRDRLAAIAMSMPPPPTTEAVAVPEMVETTTEPIPESTTEPIPEI